MEIIQLININSHLSEIPNWELEALRITVVVMVILNGFSQCSYLHTMTICTASACLRFSSHYYN